MEWIADIALKYGYDTPESFTKAFSRFHGVAPKFARDGNAKLLLFNPLAIKLTVDPIEREIMHCKTKNRGIVSTFRLDDPSDYFIVLILSAWSEPSPHTCHH